MLAGLAATPATLPARQRQIVHLVRGSDGRLRASYDAAQTTDWNKRHWARADELSAAAAGSDPVRKTVRTRARYEVANNGFARGIVNTLANWTIGSGPTLQIVGEDRDAASRIEDRFHRWAEAARLGWKLWTMRVAKCVDGETFAMLIHNPELPADVKLDLRLLECDRIVTPNFWNWNAGPFKVSGIVCDEFANPVTYHVLKHHPGNNYGGSTSDYDEVPAEHMIHLFRVDRPGQMRGVPEIMPSLESLAALRRFSLATLGAAEAAADHAVVLETEAPANEDDEEEIAELSEIELTPRMMTMLPFGTKATHIKPEHPSTTYHEYFRDKIGEAARPLDMPLNVALGNSENFNYASGRLDHQSFRKSIRVEQISVFERQALNLRVLPNWFREDRLLHREDYELAGPLATSWFWPRQEHVDPAKEAAAQDKRLKNSSTTLADEYAAEGADWERKVRQLYIERGLQDELDIERAKKRKDLLEKAGVSEDELIPLHPKSQTKGSLPDAVREFIEEEIADAVSD